MNWAEITLLVFVSLNLLFAANQHGKPKDENNNNFWITSIATAIQFGLMWFAGLFH